jgi:hypothetical protein
MLRKVFFDLIKDNHRLHEDDVIAEHMIPTTFHEEPDNSSTFMKMFKERTQTMSAVNDERCQVLPSKVIWDGTINRFEVFRNNVEGHYGQIGAGYLFDSSFQVAYLERGVDC